MRLLMVQLPTSHLGAGECVYPLGLARLSPLVPDSVEKYALDMNLAQDPWMDLKDCLERYSPHVVALSFRNMDPLAGHEASYLSSLITASRLVRRIVPRCRMLAGGPAFSLFSRQLMEAVPEIDMGIAGEGEGVFASLVSAEFTPRNIPGLLWRERGSIRFTPPDSDMDLAALPALDLETFSPCAYLEKNKYVAVMGIEGKRGCDLNCAYCVYPQLGGRKMRLRPPERIVHEMMSLNKETGAGLFHFTDGVVNRPPEHLECICRLLIKNKAEVKWTGFFREDSLSIDQLSLARDAGLVAVYLSGDALTPEGLNLLNKHLSCEDLMRAAKMTTEAGMLTVCHFMANLPGDSEKQQVKARETLEKLLEIHSPAANLGAVIFNPVRLYPGAPLTRRLIRKGLLSADTNLLYPTFYNPPETSHFKHELEIMCHSAGVFSRLGLQNSMPVTVPSEVRN